MSDNDTITYRTAVAEHGKDVVDAVLVHDRHYKDGNRKIFWFKADFEEALELVRYEQRKKTKRDT